MEELVSFFQRKDFGTDISTKSGCLLPSECLCSRGGEKKHRKYPSMWCWAWNDEPKLGLICWKSFSTQTWPMRNHPENSGEAKEPGWSDSEIPFLNGNSSPRSSESLTLEVQSVSFLKRNPFKRKLHTREWRTFAPIYLTTSICGLLMAMLVLGSLPFYHVQSRFQRVRRMTTGNILSAGAKEKSASHWADWNVTWHGWHHTFW